MCRLACLTTIFEQEYSPRGAANVRSPRNADNLRRTSHFLPPSSLPKNPPTGVRSRGLTSSRYSRLAGVAIAVGYRDAVPRGFPGAAHRPFDCTRGSVLKPTGPPKERQVDLGATPSSVGAHPVSNVLSQVACSLPHGQCQPRSPNNRRPILRESWAGPRTDSTEGPAAVAQYGAGQPLAVPVTVGCRAVLLAGSTDADLDHCTHRALLKLTSRQRIECSGRHCLHEAKAALVPPRLRLLLRLPGIDLTAAFHVP